MAAATYAMAEGGATTLQVLRNPVGLVSRKVVLADLLAAAGAGTIVEVNDIFELLKIPPRTVVLCAGVTPLVADGSTLTASLGDGSEAAGWMATLNLNATTAAMTLNDDAYGTDYMMGKYYGSADTIDLKFLSVGTQTHIGEFVVWAIMVQVPSS